MSLPDPQSIFTLTPKNSSTCYLFAFVSTVLSLTLKLAGVQPRKMNSHPGEAIGEGPGKQNEVDTA